MTERMFGFANLLVGRFRGGLAQVNIVASVIFSGMSGSALADAAGPGKLEVDMMVKAGYSPGLLRGAVRHLGDHRADHPAIDPDGALRRRLQHLDRLPVHGRRAARPAARRRRSAGAGRRPGAQPRISRTEPKPTLREAVSDQPSTPLPALLLPVILLGGIYSGAVTPTEAAAVAAFCALLLAFFWYRTLSLARCSTGAGRIRRARPAWSRITIAGALVMNWIVAAEQIPEAMGDWMTALDISPADVHVRR